MLRSSALALLVALGPLTAFAQEAPSMQGRIGQASAHMGEMSMVMPVDTPEDMAVDEVIRFEPWQMLDELFRDDIVFLMRHGPTDWSMRDAKGVAPGDCDNQRVMTEDGKERMRQLGALLVVNELVPGRILVSEWCRNQETYAAMERGMLQIDKNALDGVEVDTMGDLNLLLSLGGAPNVTNLREIVSSWEGDEDGPLLIISHFTNIAELTEFNVYEGEMLMLDPKRDNRVLGYLRLASAAPDIGHFDEAVVEAAQAAQEAASE